jgi:uncharacterized protein
MVTDRYLPLKTRHNVYAVFAVLVLTAVNAFAQSPLPSPTGHVNDYAGVINRATKTELETTLTNLDREQKIQFAVAVVDTTGGQDIFDYSREVARGWGLGSKDTTKPSLLLLVAIKDRNYFTQVSRHLEGDLPDGLVGQIQREKLVPAFRASDYSGGIRETIYEYIRTVARKQGFNTDKVFPSGTTSRPPVRETRPRANTCGSIVVIVVVALIVLALIGVARGRGRGGPGSGGSGGWLGWLLLSMLLSGRSASGSSGWSGGGFGGFSGGGGGGGGFGGFGGGGDFGGGGAGGSW